MSEKARFLIQPFVYLIDARLNVKLVVGQGATCPRSPMEPKSFKT